MRFRRSDRPADRTESDRFLDAVRAGQPTDAADEPLARLLSAAGAPARPGELAGEREALAAFRAARSAPAPAPARTPRRRRFTTGAVVWIAGIAATATAGAAFAAVTLDQPEEPAPPPRSTTPAPGPSDRESGGSPSSTGGGTPTSGAPSRTGAPSTGSAPTTRGGGPKPDGSAQVAGLCRAYLAKKPDQRAKALETPGFAPLVNAAGGAAEVEAFCRRLVPEPGAKATPEPRASRSAATASAWPAPGTDE